MTTLKNQEMINTLKQETNPEVLATKLDYFVNSMSLDVKGFVQLLSEEDDVVKLKFSRLSLLWIQKLSQFFEQGNFDLRNEYSVKTSNKLASLLGNQFLQDITSFEETVINTLSITHRTLQQSFSSIVFLWVYKWMQELEQSMQGEEVQKVSKSIIDYLGDTGYVTPYI